MFLVIRHSRSIIIVRKSSLKRTLSALKAAMRASNFLLAACNALLFTRSLAQQPNADATRNTTLRTDIPLDCLRFPRTIVGTQQYNPDAIQALSGALSDNSFNPPLPSEGITLKGGYSSRVGWAGSGGFQVCVQNFYFFNTVTVKLSEISDAVALMADQCCDSTPGQNKVPGSPDAGRIGLCQDSKATVKAIDGRTVKVVAQDYGDRCCGLWGC